MKGLLKGFIVIMNNGKENVKVRIYDVWQDTDMIIFKVVDEQDKPHRCVMISNDGVNYYLNKRAVVGDVEDDLSSNGLNIKFRSDVKGSIFDPMALMNAEIANALKRTD